MSKTWKAIVVAMMLLAVVFTAVACGQKETTPPEPVVEQVTDKVIEGFGTFTGTLVDGKPSEGTLVGSDFTYEGTFEDGYAITGTGKITYGDGVTAEGPILNKQLHGWGKVDYQNGCVGIGQWEKGVMNGIVYFCWRQPNGSYDVYYGNWTNGVREDDDAWYMFGNGTQEEMGKGVGTDASKNTFVRLYGLEKCEELVQKYTKYAIDALDAFEDTEYMIALAGSLTERRV